MIWVSHSIEQARRIGSRVLSARRGARHPRGYASPPCLIPRRGDRSRARLRRGRSSRPDRDRPLGAVRSALWRAQYRFTTEDAEDTQSAQSRLVRLARVQLRQVGAVVIAELRALQQIRAAAARCASMRAAAGASAPPRRGARSSRPRARSSRAAPAAACSAVPPASHRHGCLAAPPPPPPSTPGISRATASIKHHRRQLAAGQHIIADADLLR